MRPDSNPTPDFPPISMAALAAWRAQGRFAQAAGHRVFARIDDRHGDTRPWLLLIHGFPTASFDWHPLWAQLARDFNLLAPDLLGFGDSDKPRHHDYRIAGQADLIEHWRGQLGIERMHVLAHDYGVTVAQELLARDHERSTSNLSTRIQSIVFLNGGLFPEAHRPRLIQKLLLTPLGPLFSRLLTKSTFARSFRAIFGPKSRPSAGEIDAFWALIAAQNGHHIAHRLMRYVLERKSHRERWVGALTRTTIPMRLVDGALDPVSGTHLVTRYRELIGEADVVWLDDIGHYPQVEAPARVHASLCNFWRRAGAMSPMPAPDDTPVSNVFGARHD